MTEKQTELAAERLKLSHLAAALVENLGRDAARTLAVELEQAVLDDERREREDW